VVGCAGAFQPGDAVQVIEVPGQVPVGKGIVRLATDELRSVAGMQSDAVRARYPEAPTQVIHRDEFVLVEGGKATGHDPAEPGTAHGEDGHG
jgi:glutamate 5-kinase